ncbi:MAG TPA: TatD family hydrolase [Candidatus Saccharimonadales bacterium]|nr:TatD family hydrolase [Candidatus Saccharimonadales bacterium]
MLIDTHCHIHEASYPLDAGDVLQHARSNGVEKLICVGTNMQSSREALTFAAAHERVFASIGVHPHDVKDGYEEIKDLLLAGPVAESAPDFRSITNAKSGAAPLGATRGDQSRLVAIGEIGLDYFYTHSPRQLQIKALQVQIELALAHDLPIIFHVRDASSPEQRGSVWRDFWPILDNYQGIRGVLHSFSDTQANLDEALRRGLYIGVNGISTFTKDAAQQRMFAQIPLEKLLLETDAPFLTPVPLRGNVNEPAFVRQVAEHHATIRGLTLDDIATATSTNAHALFAL